jgi:hypothetical protein
MPLMPTDERPDLHELPTPRTTLAARNVTVRLWCKSCRHQADADLQALVDAGRGDVPLIDLRFRCGNCRSKLTDFVCTSRSGALERPGGRTDGPAEPVAPLAGSVLTLQL